MAIESYKDIFIISKTNNNYQSILQALHLIWKNKIKMISALIILNKQTCQHHIMRPSCIIQNYIIDQTILMMKIYKRIFLCISINKEIRWSKADLRIPLMINGKSMPGQKHLEYIILYTQIITAYLIGCVLVLFKQCHWNH